MIKKYVCEHCHGSGEVLTWNLIEDENPPANPNDPTGQIEDVIEKCPLCTGLGLPPAVELRVNGPVSPREITVDAQMTVVVPPVLEEPK